MLGMLCTLGHVRSLGMLYIWYMLERACSLLPDKPSISTMAVQWQHGEKSCILYSDRALVHLATLCLGRQQHITLTRSSHLVCKG